MFDDMFTSGSALARFSLDLTAMARAGRLDPVRCRDAEIERVVDILLRQHKNNPALVGPAGVGKTAIVEGLAQRIAAGNVALALRDVRVLALDHMALLAGTTFRGQYEERIRSIVAEVSAATDVILFIDELHNLIGQGTAMGVAMDAANMLKPALVRGEFRVIGATTDAEYAQWIRGDPALERRFQKVDVRELGVPETMEILRARKLGLERHHNVVIADDALEAAVELTDRYVTDRTRPDRAIDALDEACAHRQATTVYSPETEALVRERRQRVAEAMRQADPAARARAASTEETVEEDPIGDFARGGFEALERFGAELEAMFAGAGASGTPATDGVAAPDAPASEPRSRANGGAEDAAKTGRAGPAGEPSGASASSAAATRTLAELDVELARTLTAEGIVVRVPDIERVVSVALGRTVRRQPA